MKISQIIAQLRTKMPPLNGQPWGDRIAGAAEFAAVEDKQRLALPSLFVLLGNSTATDDAPRGTFQQTLTDRITIIAVLNNQDRRGQSAQDLAHDIRTGLFLSILNWTYEPEFAYPIKFIGDSFINQDRARYFHQYEFMMERVLEPSDGVALSLDDFDTLYADIDVTDSDVSPDASLRITDLYNPGG